MGIAGIRLNMYPGGVNIFCWLAAAKLIQGNEAAPGQQAFNRYVCVSL